MGFAPVDIGAHPTAAPQAIQGEARPCSVRRKTDLAALIMRSQLAGVHDLLARLPVLVLRQRSTSLRRPSMFKGAFACVTGAPRRVGRPQSPCGGGTR
jgi:hypothetical protein